MQPDALYRVSNNAGWYRTFAVNRRAAGDPPWAGVPAWSGRSAVPLGSARVYAGDLYVTRPDLTAGFTSASSFAADVDGIGPLWLKVGDATSYTAVPIDLTGAVLVMALKAIDANGVVIDPRPKLLCGTADGCLAITNAKAGGIAQAVPRARVRTVDAGLYALDVVATWPTGRTERVKYGPVEVQQGISP